MANEMNSSHVDSHSKNTASKTSKISGREQQLFKSLIRKRAEYKENPLKDSKKPSVSAHNGKELLNAVRKGSEKKKPSISANSGKELISAVSKGTEKLNMKEGKKKPKMCFCAPTTHEGSFRCRLHRISKKSAIKKSIAEFKPQLSRFGRIASAEVGSQSHDSMIQLSGVESV